MAQRRKAMKRAFEKTHQEIELLRIKIYQKKGIFFRTHIHTAEELLHSEHISKVASITGTSGFYHRHDRKDCPGLGALPTTYFLGRTLLL